MDERQEEAVRARGGCHCGAVQFEVHGPLRDVIICHCEDCRRIHGHASAHTAARIEDVRITRGRARLRWYASSERARRGFCSRCGAALFFDLHGRDVLSISAGVLEPPTGVRTALHVFAASAADYEASDEPGLARRPGLPEPEDRLAWR